MVVVLAGCAPPGSTGRSASPRLARADSIARAAIAAERTLDASALPSRAVGVVPLDVAVRDSALSSLGYGLADLLTSDLARARELVVVERLNVDALLRELSLARSGRVDSATAPRIGRLLGARRLVTGGVAQAPDDRLTIAARIADVSSGEMLAATTAAVSVDGILDAQKELTFVILDRLGVNLSPAERAAIDRRPTRNVAALLAYSRAVREESMGAYGRAAGGFAEAVRLDPGFTRARERLAEAQAMAGIASSEGDGSLQRALGLAGTPINRPSSPRVADAVDPGFRNNAQQLVSIIIRVSIP